MIKKGILQTTDRGFKIQPLQGELPDVRKLIVPSRDSNLSQCRPGCEVEFEWPPVHDTQPQSKSRGVAFVNVIHSTDCKKCNLEDKYKLFDQFLALRDQLIDNELKNSTAKSLFNQYKNLLPKEIQQITKIAGISSKEDIQQGIQLIKNLSPSIRQKLKKFIQTINMYATLIDAHERAKEEIHKEIHSQYRNDELYNKLGELDKQLEKIKHSLEDMEIIRKEIEGQTIQFDLKGEEWYPVKYKEVETEYSPDPFDDVGSWIGVPSSGKYRTTRKIWVKVNKDLSSTIKNKAEKILHKLIDEYNDLQRNYNELLRQRSDLEKQREELADKRHESEKQQLDKIEKEFNLLMKDMKGQLQSVVRD